jgi:hypothetical protein
VKPKLVEGGNSSGGYQDNPIGEISAHRAIYIQNTHQQQSATTEPSEIMRDFDEDSYVIGDLKHGIVMSNSS